MARTVDLPSPAQTTAQPAQVLYVSLELSPSKWLVTVLLSGTSKMSKHVIAGGDGSRLLGLLADLKAKVEQRTHVPVTVVAIQEAGLDGFSVHRLLEANGIESWVVDPASVAVPRRMRRAKSDAIDGETLLRTLLAFRRASHESARWCIR
jgi:transposase